LKKYWVLSTSILLINIFLPHNSYAANMPVANGFDYPLGKPNGNGYGVECCGGLTWLEGYDYEGDYRPEFHPGEDWNNDSSGDDYGGNRNDAGDPVYAIADGMISSAGYERRSWGYVVLIEHNLRDGTRLWSQYAHLSNIDNDFKNKVGAIVKRGDTIGRVGDYENGTGRRFHLHFEIRKKYRPANAFVFDWSKSKVQQYYINPSAFIKANRPVPPPEPQKLSITTTGRNGAGLSWDEATGKEFEKYELYRSETAGGTKDSDKREKIGTFTDSKTLTYTDPNLYSDQSYYYRILTHYKNDQVVSSNEVTIKFDREIINVSNKPGIQRYARIMGNKIYWEDMVREQTSFPQKRTFYYYDIEKKIVESIVIGNQIDNRIQGPYKPSIGAEWLCYYGRGSAYKNYDIYCRNMASDMPVDIQITLSGAVDADPEVSEDGILVWTSLANNIQQVYWTDLNGPPQIQLLSNSSSYQQSPRIWGHNVIWLNYVETRHKNLMYKNIATGEEKVLVDEVGDGEINIWEDYVTYIKDGKLLLLRLTDEGEPTIISTAGQNGHIRDGRVVYTKDGSDGNYIYVYEIATKKTYMVAGPIKFQPSAFIYENMIVFDSSPTDDTNDFDIYLTYL
jgi:hypothetical protein